MRPDNICKICTIKSMPTIWVGEWNRSEWKVKKCFLFFHTKANVCDTPPFVSEIGPEWLVMRELYHSPDLVAQLFEKSELKRPSMLWQRLVFVVWCFAALHYCDASVVKYHRNNKSQVHLCFRGNTFVEELWLSFKCQTVDCIRNIFPRTMFTRQTVEYWHSGFNLSSGDYCW